MYQGASGRLFDFDYGDSGFLLVNYPGVMLHAFGDTSDMNLFLKEEIDFVSLKNRNKDTKLVVLFGACTIRGGAERRVICCEIFKRNARFKLYSAKLWAICCYLGEFFYFLIHFCIRYFLIL